MELDGFNEKLKIAFEYNGEQHYKMINKFYKSENKLTQRMIDDVCVCVKTE